MEESLCTISNTAAALKLNGTGDIAVKAQQLYSELKEKDKTIESLNSKLADTQVSELIANAKEINGLKVIAVVLPNLTADSLRTMCDKVRDHMPESVAVIATINNGKATIAATAGKAAQAKGIHAGKMAGQIAKMAGGNGGGKPDFAMAGAKDLNLLNQAVSSVEKIVAES